MKETDSEALPRIVLEPDVLLLYMGAMGYNEGIANTLYDYLFKNYSDSGGYMPGEPKILAEGICGEYYEWLAIHEHSSS